MVDSLYKKAVDSMFECPRSFTKEQWIQKIEEKEVMVKDIEILVNLFLKMEIIKSVGDDLYQITIEKAFEHVYGKR